jgi:cephalosporin-C deacetylase-like acetyl esterase
LRQQIGANFLVPDPLPALDARTHRRFTTAPGVKAEGVTYTTQLGARVPAILYLPDPLPPTGKIPAFIVVNGDGGGAKEVTGYVADLWDVESGGCPIRLALHGTSSRIRQI